MTGEVQVSARMHRCAEPTTASVFALVQPAASPSARPGGSSGAGGSDDGLTAFKL